MKVYRNFFLGFFGIILAGLIGAFLGPSLLQLLFWACLVTAVVVAVVYFWTRERALAVGLLTGVTSPLWGGVVFLLVVAGCNWISDIPDRNVVEKIEQYKRINNRYPDTLARIGVQNQAKEGYSYKYVSDSITFGLCGIYDEEHSFGPGVAGQCYDSKTKKWANYSESQVPQRFEKEKKF